MKVSKVTGMFFIHNRIPAEDKYKERWSTSPLNRRPRRSGAQAPAVPHASGQFQFLMFSPGAPSPAANSGAGPIDCIVTKRTMNDVWHPVVTSSTGRFQLKPAEKTCPVSRNAGEITVV